MNWLLLVGFPVFFFVLGFLSQAVPGHLELRRKRKERERLESEWRAAWERFQAMGQRAENWQPTREQPSFYVSIFGEHGAAGEWTWKPSPR